MKEKAKKSTKPAVKDLKAKANPTGGSMRTAKGEHIKGKDMHTGIQKAK